MAEHGDPPTDACPGDPAPIARQGWWRLLFDEAEEPQILCRQAGIVDLNPPARSLLADPTKAGWPELMNLLGSEILQRVSGVLQSEVSEPVTFEAVEIRIRDERHVSADLRLVPLGDGYGLLSLRDCGPRQRLESQTRLLTTAIDATPNAVFLTDADFHLRFVNPAFQSATGFSIEDALGKETELFRDPSQGSLIGEYLEAVREGHDWTGELLNRRTDGSVYPVEAVISPVFDRKGKLVGCVGFERDLTLRKTLQSDLLLERDLVRSILDSIGAAVYTLDRDFRLTDLNETARQSAVEGGALAMKAPPPLQAPFLDSIGLTERREQLEALFAQVLQTGEPAEMSTSDEQARHWAIRISSWRHRGHIHGLICTVLDHTRLHQLQNQLFQAQKMETVGALAAGVAHDFNNLLMAIRGNATLMLLEDQLSSVVRQRLQKIDQAADRAAAITRQLLSFSRASEEQIGVLDFNLVVQEATELARRVIRQHVDFQIQLSPNPVKVRMDVTRAQQVLLNLCVNAQDAMTQGGTLKVQVDRVSLDAVQAKRVKREPSDRFVRCEVTDSGSGIPSAVLAHIFDPFYTTKEKGKGTGLGLAVVQSAVTEAGGFVEVTTNVGVGTTFSIFLPEADNEVAAKPKEKRPTLKKGSGRILLVDDQDLVLDFAQKFLRAAGYEVSTASSGEEALQVLDSLTQPIDLLLTDYSMPGMNGCQLIDAVAERSPSTKFILASGYLEDDEREDIESRRGTRILGKPFNLSEAADLIAGMLKSVRTAD